MNPIVLPEVTLKEAAQVLRNQGWVQSEWGDHKSARCVMGAIAQVTVDSGLGGWWPAKMELLRRLGIPNGLDIDQIEWNNALGRTFDEVLAVLEGGSQ